MYGRFVLLCSRSQHSVGKQLCSNNTDFKKLKEKSGSKVRSFTLEMFLKSESEHLEKQKKKSPVKATSCKHTHTHTFHDKMPMIFFADTGRPTK